MRALSLLLCLLPLLQAESAAGLKWTAPAGWKNQGSRPMRAATYAVDDGECVVYFFGAGQGGTVEANLDRWKNQFQQPGGQPAATQIKKRAIHGLPVTTIETSGDYSGMGGPLAEKPTTKSGYRLLGAIVEGPLGNVFLKFVGPAKTIAANEKNFEILLSSFEKK